MQQLPLILFRNQSHHQNGDISIKPYHLLGNPFPVENNAVKGAQTQTAHDLHMRQLEDVHGLVVGVFAQVVGREVDEDVEMEVSVLGGEYGGGWGYVVITVAVTVAVALISILAKSQFAVRRVVGISMRATAGGPVAALVAAAIVNGMVRVFVAMHTAARSNGMVSFDGHSVTYSVLLGSRVCEREVKVDDDDDDDENRDQGHIYTLDAGRDYTL